MTMRSHWRDMTGSDAIPQEVHNLNELGIPDADSDALTPISLRRESVISETGVEVIFQRLEDRLVFEIENAEAVVGCMAWLTNTRVLDAMAKCRFVSVLVQKEDFLRPDTRGWTKERLHKQYDALPIGSRYNVQSGYSFCSDDTLAPIRCVGIVSDGPTVPRMHHKFLIFGAMRECDETELFCPTSVWTGSFNASNNGARSLENAVIMDSLDVCCAYFEEYRTLLGISEPLDWSSKWVKPEYRIGS